MAVAGQPDNGDVATHISSPRFIGRRTELEQVASALADPTSARSSIVLVAGEAGVGKTRFVQEAIGSARDTGALALSGGCIELGGAGLPFAPIAEVLRSLTTGLSRPQVEQLLGSARSELGRLLPDFAREAGGADQHEPLAQVSVQARLYEVFLGLLRQIAGERPILLVLEDLHWADRSTLGLLAYLGRGTHDVGLLVMGTYRNDELHRRHPLLPILAELDRARIAERIELARFGRPEVAEQVAGIRGAPADQALLERIYDRTDGNAFYVEELLAARSSGSRLTEQLRDVLLARVAGLSDSTQELLRVASASGPRIRSGTLARVAAIAEDDLFVGLREAVDRHVLVQRIGEDGDPLAFRHALVQEALYDDLLPDERARIHARFADALASDADGPGQIQLAAELAYHWYAAHDLPRALGASVEAGAAAASVYAFADAQAQYERALELWDQVPDADRLTGLDRAGLLENAARVAALAHPPRAVALVREAIGLVDPVADPTRAGLLHERLGRYSWTAGDGATALTAHREAIRLVPATPPTIARSRVTAGLCQILMVEGALIEGRHVCEEAVAVARAIGARELEGHALNSLGVTMAYQGDLDGGLANLREAQRIGLGVDNVDDVARAYENLIDVLNNAGRFADASELSIEAFDYARAHGLAEFYGSTCLCEGASALQRLGRWTAAAQMIERARHHEISGVPEVFIQQRLALLDVGQGRREVATARLDRLRLLSEDMVEVQWVAPLAEAAGELAVWEGRPLDARREVLDAIGRISILPGMIARVGPLFAIGMRAEADLVVNVRRSTPAVAAAGRVVAERYLQTLSELRDEIVVGLPPYALLAEAYLSIGQAEFGRVLGANDPTRWSLAAQAFAAIPMAYPRAYALWREAEAILASSRARATAASPLREAHAIALELGAEPLAGAIEALAARARIEVGEAAPRRAPGGLDSFGLTAREREVLDLVAVGRTNRQIATALFITEKTASVHVSNILAKLDVKGRTEAAAMAHRLTPGDGGDRGPNR